MKNQEIAAVFREIADMLEIKGENRYRILAYRRAADQIASEVRSIADLAEQGRLQEIPGIGEAIAGKINDLLTTGHIELHDRLREEIPPGVVALLSIPDVGPKTTRLLWEKLGLASIEDVDRAARAGLLRQLPGLGAKSEANIIRGIEMLRRRTGRSLLGNVLPVAEALLAGLRECPAVLRADAAGSVRRRKPTIGDLDLLAASRDPAAVMEHFVHPGGARTALPGIEQVQLRGDTKTTVVLHSGLQVDLRVLPPENYGALLQYFTGSKDHNVQLRELAQKQNLSLSEYGFARPDGTLIECAEEAEVYEMLGLTWIPPELREAAGEIKAAQKGRLPQLIALEDVRGDLQMHTRWSDGRFTIEEMAQVAMELGYDYIAITDHTRGLGVAGGLTPEQFQAQRREIEAVNQRSPAAAKSRCRCGVAGKLAPFRVLAGCEVEIRGDGTLDLPDEVLAEFDIVLASIHSGMRQDRETMTRRVLSAVRHPYVDVIAHPTGRLLGEREPLDLDFEALVEAAAETGAILEINANPRRLDLDGEHARLARDRGALLSLGTDAHDVTGLADMPFGVAMARRGWAEAGDVINTLPLSELLARLKRNRAR